MELEACHPARRCLAARRLISGENPPAASRLSWEIAGTASYSRQEPTAQRQGVHSWYRSAQVGYTVIEALITVVILGILLGIAYQRLSPALEHAKVNRAASVLAADLQYARMVAVRSRRPVVVIAMSSVKGYVIRQRDSAIVYRERFLGPGTEFGLDLFSSSPGSSVEIFPNSVAAITTTFTLGLGGYQRKVKISRAGQVRVIRGL